MSYISLGDLGKSCERINNNLSLVIIIFTVNRDLKEKSPVTRRVVTGQQGLIRQAVNACLLTLLQSDNAMVNYQPNESIQ